MDAPHAAIDEIWAFLYPFYKECPIQVPTLQHTPVPAPSLVVAGVRGSRNRSHYPILCSLELPKSLRQDSKTSIGQGSTSEKSSTAGSSASGCVKQIKDCGKIDLILANMTITDGRGDAYAQDNIIL